MEGKKATNLYNVTMTARRRRRMGDWVLSLSDKLSVRTPIQVKKEHKEKRTNDHEWSGEWGEDHPSVEAPSVPGHPVLNVLPEMHQSGG